MTNVVQLHEVVGEGARIDPAAALRAAADRIDAGDFGEVRQCVLVLSANSIEVFGSGDAPVAYASIAVLHAGAAKLLNLVHPA